MGNCSKKKIENKLINNLKLSVFCGLKGFCTFNLACFSYLESLAYRRNTNGPAFAIRRNIIPFFEMITIIPTVFLLLPNIRLISCTLICVVLMISACLIVRTFNLREKILEKTTYFSMQEITKELCNNDTIIYPIFSKNSKYIKYSIPDREQVASHSMKKERESFFVNFLLPIKVLQSCMLLSLSMIELLESLPSLAVDLFYDRKFQSTQSNLQRCFHLLYASVRNIIPISRFDESIAELVINSNKTFSCCSKNE